MLTIDVQADTVEHHTNVNINDKFALYFMNNVFVENKDEYTIIFTIYEENFI